MSNALNPDTEISSGIYHTEPDFALKMDADDPLAHFRREFHIPVTESGAPFVYLAGHSLGLQPKKTAEYLNRELEDWAKLGVEGHMSARRPWLPYHENLTAMTARLVGALPDEVVVMNSLTVNLHLMMVSFYRPETNRYKILLEKNSFPSDFYAACSQAKFHGFSPGEAVVELPVREGERCHRMEDILAYLHEYGSSIALVLLGNVNYLTGQAFDIAAITKAAHEKGCLVGLNLAHGAGNLELRLHDWNVDFAVWCGYKYLNGGPGTLAGAFVHERFAQSFDLPRFAGWWGHNKESRFKMALEFDPLSGAEGWQLSNPPIFQLAALLASLELFDQAGIKSLRSKSVSLTGYLDYLLRAKLHEKCRVITPSSPEERGCQISIGVDGKSQEVVRALKSIGVICDPREPDIIRAAPCPLYNSYLDVHTFVEKLATVL